MLKHLAAIAAVALTANLYATEWDLSALPSYQPDQKVSGVIRMGGASMSGLVVIWEKEFQKVQPDVKFTNELPSSDTAFGYLTTGQADIAPSGREPALVEVLGFSEKFGHNATPIVVGTGAWHLPGGSSWSPVVFVSKDNPLEKLTIKQLDGIFGAERTGGYPENSCVYTASAARGPEGDIRTWGQLGLTGEWANKPIQTYGYADTGMRHFFELKVFAGGDKWNPNYREYVETGTKMVEGGTSLGSHDMLLALSHDKYGIGWSGLGHAASVEGLKPIPVANDDGSPAAELTEKSFQSHAYPLSRVVFMYINRDDGKPVDPKVREFIRFILSREGQNILAHNGYHLPLPAEMVAEQRKKLD